MPNEDLIFNTVRDLDDYEEAAAAIIELKYRNQQTALELAMEILRDKCGDSHFQAGAFEILYSIDRPTGLEFICANVKDANLILLKSMIECVTEDSSLSDSQPEILKAAREVKKATERLSPHDRSKILESLEWLHASFPEDN
ncbi:MAG TPA: hypothetical protein VD840_08220 [Sinorhizobium sp.]|nr:hypothetical protein [Sinorhizobium sp.]